jgi:phosphocarrier protein
MSTTSGATSTATDRFEIVNALGLHARAATKLVQLASAFPCEIQIAREGQVANAKSVMGVLLLCGAQGTFVDVTAKGDRASEAVRAIGELIASRFGEAE